MQEEYLKQYMAQVALVQQRQAQARAGTLDGQGQQELKDLKTDLAIAKGSIAASPPICVFLYYAFSFRRIQEKGKHLLQPLYCCCSSSPLLEPSETGWAIARRVVLAAYSSTLVLLFCSKSCEPVVAWPLPQAMLIILLPPVLVLSWRIPSWKPQNRPLTTEKNSDQ